MSTTPISAFIFLFIQFLVYALGAIHPYYFYKSWTAAIICIGLEQDEQGFVWIGTRNGLACYDGTKFINFQHDIHDISSLAANIIIWLKRDNSNHLLIENE